MEKNKWLFHLWKILWVVGLIILAVVIFNIEHQLQLWANETFNYLLDIWSRPLILILFGLYISLLFIKKWSMKINSSLLWCVAIPCMLLSFAYPVLITSSNESPGFFIDSSFSLWIYIIYHSNVFGIVAGLTLILSFFKQPKFNVPS